MFRLLFLMFRPSLYNYTRKIIFIVKKIFIGIEFKEVWVLKNLFSNHVIFSFWSFNFGWFIRDESYKTLNRLHSIQLNFIQWLYWCLRTNLYENKFINHRKTAIASYTQIFIAECGKKYRTGWKKPSKRIPRSGFTNSC